MNLDDVLDGITERALSNLRDASKEVREAAEELRERVRVLVQDQAAIAARAMAGHDVSEARAALEARVHALAAAGLSISQREVERAVHSAILTAIEVAFQLLFRTAL